MSLMVIKNSFSIAIRGAIPDSEYAKEYMNSVEEQFKGIIKAHASTSILKMLMTKYDGVSGVREHIMMMTDMAHKLKAMCVQEEERLKIEKPDVAYVTTTHQKKKGKYNITESSKIQQTNANAAFGSTAPKGPFRCKFCHQKGHSQ
ncbi:unnamed protein product, partial [Cuscuta epithymum]